METEYSKHLIYGNYRSMPGQDFPMDCETLAALQNNIQKLAVIASVAGCDRLVLTGCEVQGNVRSGGYVFVRGAENPDTGEILYHPQQPTSDYCRIVETHEHVNANTIEYREAYTQRHLASREGVGAMLWSSFKTLGEMSLSALLTAIRKEATDREAAIQQVKDDSSVKFVRGMILMWSGYVNEIPDGWALCDGTNGTPPLSGRFVVCVKKVFSDSSGNNFYNEGEKDGAESRNITLTVANMPKHKHSGSTDYAGNHRHRFEDAYYAENINGQAGSYFGSDEGYDQDNTLFTRTAFTEYEPNHKHTFTTDEVGGGQPFTVDTMPPFYALAYIMKL